MEPGKKAHPSQNLVLLINVRPKHEIAFALSSCTELNFTISSLILAIILEPLVERAPALSRQLF